MTTVLVYQPELWHDYFVMVGGGAAALTGLVFVAMSLNLAVIAQDATHRFRAIGTLTGFMSVFVACALGLMGTQTHRSLGVEWLLVGAAAFAVYVVGYVLAIRQGGSPEGLYVSRLVLGTSFYVVELVGAAALLLGYAAGLYLATAAMVALLAWGVTGAWLLLLGVHRQ